MPKGRKKDPPAAKIQRAERKARATAAAEPKSDLPSCPDFLEGDGRDEWGRILRDLRAAGIKVATHDRAILELYCMAYSRWRKACRELEASEIVLESMSGAVKSNPAATAANQAEATMARLLAELGLTPNARNAVRASSEAPKDQLSAFLAQAPSS